MQIPPFIKPVILLVTGGRDFNDKKRCWRTLDGRSEYWLSRYPEKRIFLVNGGATGLDTLAREWAEKRDQAFATIPAEWDRLGKTAGFQRNLQMLQWFRPDEVIAFPGGPGTANMVDTCVMYEQPVLLLKEEPGQSEYLRPPGNDTPWEAPEPAEAKDRITYWWHASSDCCVKAHTAAEANSHAAAGCDEIDKQAYDKWVELDIGDLI